MYTFGSIVPSDTTAQRADNSAAAAAAAALARSSTILQRQRGRFDGNPKVISTLSSLRPLGSSSRETSAAISLDSRQ